MRLVCLLLSLVVAAGAPGVAAADQHTPGVAAADAGASGVAAGDAHAPGVAAGSEPAPGVAGADAHTPGRREDCRVCGMYIDRYERTSARLTRTTGAAEPTCGVACMLRIVHEEGTDTFSSITVHDWNDGSVVDAREATYVLGSSEVPDMIPNFLAFKSAEDARAFQGAHGGAVIDFAEALEIISPRGITNPFRIQPAVAPPPGAFSAAIAYGFLTRDDVVIGSSRKDPQQFISGRPGQMRAPKKLEVQTQALVLNYGITDRLAAFLSMPYVEKHGEAYQKDPKTGAIRSEHSHNDGWGDLDLRVRYNLWRTAYYDRFFTLLTGMTLPTGGFDRKYIDSPGLQLGTGAVSVTPGLLFSARWSHLWLHWSGTYSVKTENSDDYRFGNEFATGVALHFTPHYDLMVGVEADATLSDKNEYKGKDVENTGGTRTNLTFVGDWRFWNVWGGNFTLRGSIGLPVYEDLNSQRMGEATRAQLGGGFYANVVVSYTTQFDLL